MYDCFCDNRTAADLPQGSNEWHIQALAHKIVGVRSLVALGAIGVQCKPTVSVWDVHSMQELVQLEHSSIKRGEDQTEEPMGGVQAVAAVPFLRLAGAFPHAR